MSNQKDQIQKEVNEINAANEKVIEIIHANEQRVRNLEKMASIEIVQRSADTVKPPPTDE